MARRIAFRLLILAVGVAPPAIAADRVAVVLSDSGEAYDQVAAALRRELHGVAVEVAQWRAAEADGLGRGSWRVAVGVGAEACRRVVADAATASAVLCTLLPRVAYERIAEDARKDGRTLAAVFLDQAMARQMALIRAALPERRRVAVLLGADSQVLEPALKSAAAARGLRLHVQGVRSPEELPHALQQALGDADVLLAVPDSTVLNSITLPLLLRSAIRSRIPLVAFSPAFVRAGALLAVHSTPTQIGAQTGRTLRAMLEGIEVPGRQFPREFEVATNPHVARALGIELDEAGAIAARLRSLEDAR